jgi:hypothetical protein
LHPQQQAEQRALSWPQQNLYKICEPILFLLAHPTAPTAAYNDNSTTLATTAFVQGEKTSPAFSGVPTAPTAQLL